MKLLTCSCNLYGYKYKLNNYAVRIPLFNNYIPTFDMPFLLYKLNFFLSIDEIIILNTAKEMDKNNIRKKYTLLL